MTENQLTCSSSDCQGILTGQAVVIYDTEGGTNWQEHFATFELMDEGGERREVLILHPRCFQLIFDELQKIEASVTWQFVMGSVTDIREALEIA